MNKVLARYFVKLIAENLQFSFNGMGIPSYSCEWLENQLIQENYDKVKEFIQKRYDEHEHENSAKDTNVCGKKPKRKFRAMTVKEYCDKVGDCKKCPYCFDTIFCDYMEFNGIVKMKTSVTPYKTKDGKYILIEVTNDA